MSHPYFDKVVSNMKTRVATPQVELRHFSLSSANSAKVILHITHKQNSRTNKNSLREAVRAKFDNALDVVESSFVKIASDEFSDTAKGILSVVRKSVPYVEGSTRGFTSVATNMYMDSEHTLWNLKKTAAGNLLVQTSSLEDEDSLQELLAGSLHATSLYSPDYKAFSSVSSNFEQASGGDFVSYVGKNGFSLGYVLASVDSNEESYVVLAHNSEEPEVIRSQSIMYAFDDSDAPALPKKEVAQFASKSAACNEIVLNDILAYYKMVYSRRPEYYKQFEARLRSHCFM